MQREMRRAYGGRCLCLVGAGGGAKMGEDERCGGGNGFHGRREGKVGEFFRCRVWVQMPMSGFPRNFIYFLGKVLRK